MIPIVTVTYTPDKWQVLLQAHSLEKFVIEPTTHYVIIEDDQTPFLEWRCLLEPIYKRNKLVLLNQENYKEIFPKSPKDKIMGYYRQQFLKFTSCLLTDSEYVISLDSKNVFFKPIDLVKVFHGKEGGATVMTENIEFFKKPLAFYESWLTLLDTFLNKKRPSLYFPITPFVFNTKVVKNILNSFSLENLFLEAIKINANISEYLLYSYFHDTEFVNRKWGSGNNSLHFENNKIKQMTYDSSETFTMYRLSLEEENNREMTSKFLLDIGLEEKYVIPGVYLTTANR